MKEFILFKRLRENEETRFELIEQGSLEHLQYILKSRCNRALNTPKVNTRETPTSLYIDYRLFDCQHYYKIVPFDKFTRFLMDCTIN